MLSHHRRRRSHTIHAGIRRGLPLLCLLAAALNGHRAAAQPFYNDYLATSDHYRAASVLLQDGSVLVLGGGTTDNPVQSTKVCERHDPYINILTIVQPMATARAWHSAVLLHNGEVLAIGGYTGRTIASCELFNPSGNMWRGTGPMATSRSRTTATLLPDGRVLVAGGYTNNGGGVAVTSSCEIYDPITGTWSPTAPMSTGRSSHAAVLLNSGLVLVVSGYPYYSSCELYDPGTGTWRATAPILGDPCGEHSLTKLRDGRVLLTGGWGGTKGMFNRCEIYDPATEQWRMTAPMSTPRASHRAVLLPNGKVFVMAGHDAKEAGADNTCFSVASTEIFDPASERWSSGPSLPSPISYFSAVLLPSGFITVNGGGKRAISQDPELYHHRLLVGDMMNARTVATGTLSRAHVEPRALALSDGTVALIGGGTDCSPTATDAGEEIFDTRSGRWASASGASLALRGHTATLMPDGSVIAVGGTAAGTPTDAVYRRDPSGTWTAASRLRTARAEHTATLLMGGELLVIGGTTPTGPTASVEILRPGATVWDTVSPMPVPLHGHTATLLRNGQVLVTGGADSSGASARCFLYTPGCDTWRPEHDLMQKRMYHTATLLPRGWVLITGGETPTDTASSEVFSMYSGTSYVGAPKVRRRHHTATLLPNGDVVVIGGVLPDGTSTATTEIFNAIGRTWRPGPVLPASRADHAAALLPDGTILIAGGARHGVSSCTAVPECLLFDPDPGFAPSARPVITSLTSIPAPLTGTGDLALHLEGTGFTGGNSGTSSEGSTGDYNNAPTNYPVVHIRRVGAATSGDDFTAYLPFNAGAGRWSSTATDVLLPLGAPNARVFPAGTYALTVIANAVPSLPVYFSLDYRDTIDPQTPVVSSLTDGCGSVSFRLNTPCLLKSLEIDSTASDNVSITVDPPLPSEFATVVVRLIDTARDGTYTLRVNGQLSISRVVSANTPTVSAGKADCRTYAFDITSPCGLESIEVDSAAFENLTMKYEPALPANTVHVVMRLIDPTRDGRYALRVNGRPAVTDTVHATSVVDLGGITSATLSGGCEEITIRNRRNDQPLIIDRARLAHNLQFSMPPSQFPIVIPPGGSRTLQVCYAATIAAAPNDTLMIGTGCDSIALPLVPLIRSLAFTGTGENCGASLDFRPAKLNKPFFVAGLPMVDDGAGTVVIPVDAYSPAGTERWAVRGTIYTMLGEPVAAGQFAGTAAVDSAGRTLQHGSLRFDARSCVAGVYVAVLPTPDGVVSRRIRIVR